MGRLRHHRGRVEEIAVVADDGTLVVGVLVRRTGHVSVGEGRCRAGLAHLQLRVVELLLVLGAQFVPAKRRHALVDVS